MPDPTPHLLRATAASVLACAVACGARAQDAPAGGSSDIVVTAARAGAAALNRSGSATGIDLSLKETPQSVSVVDRQRIADFQLNNVNDLLGSVTGVTVERTETDRTEYTSRGFDITNFQVDSIGLPLFYNIQSGALDTVLYDRVEVVRGANAIMTGIGNPSATVDYVRKRPTAKTQAEITVSAGSFGEYRGEGDVSGALDAAGTLRGRLIGARDDYGSWLDHNHTDREVGAALLAWDITPKLTATVGYARSDNRARGVLWGALPLVYADGSRIDYPRSASTTAPWTYWNNLDQTAFAELVWRLPGDWSVRGVTTYHQLDSHARLLYAYGAPDPLTGEGVTGTAGIYPSRYRQYMADAYASGSFPAFGRRHQLAFGFASGWSKDVEYEATATDAVDYGDIRQLSHFDPAEPDFSALTKQADVNDRLFRLYGAAHLNVTDRLHGLVGASAMWLTTTGASYGVDQARSNSKVSPYAGLLFDLTRHITAYGSYLTIFNPQNQVDATDRRLDPAKGSSIEAGLKGEWLNGRLYAGADWFHARQNGLATYAGTFGAGNDAGPIGTSFYTGLDTIAEGEEVEVSGRVSDHWMLAGGFTHLSLHDPDGHAARTFIPRNSLKLSATYTIPRWRDLKLGAQLRYQSGIRTTSGILDAAGDDIAIRQHGYTVVDLLAAIRVAPHLHASLNARNVGNVKYLGTLEYGQAYYAQPRSFLGAIRYDY